MNRRVRGSMAAAAALLAVTLAGCRQPDGQVPVQVGEQTNKTHDISRDLQNVAGKAANAGSELNDDLGTLGGAPPPPELKQELSAALEGALTGRKLPDDAAKKIADTLFVVLTARDLSRKQIEQVNTELAANLKMVGVEETATEPVTTAAYKLQTALTQNQKRWYHLF